MARISTYTIDSSIDGTEFVLGREADGTTKQFSMSALQTFLATAISPTTVFANIDINGGAIDGTPIGATSASTGAFTNITASGTAGITGDTTIGGTLGVTGATTLSTLVLGTTLSVGGSVGTNGQVLISTGSDTEWHTLDLDHLLDVKVADNSLYLGHDPSSNVGFSSAQYNIAVGATALDAVTTGDRNIAIGHNALGAATAVDSVVAIGYEAGKALVSATEAGGSVFIGSSAGAAVTVGCCNLAIGSQALSVNTTGEYNTAVGYFSLATLNTSGSNIPMQNTAFGSHAGRNATYGDNGTYIGNAAGTNVTTASNNTLVGCDSGKFTTTGEENVAVGAQALETNITGSDSVAVGYQALFTSNVVDARNVAIGHKAGYATTTGVQNAFVGYAAGSSNTTGGNNIALGAGSLLSNTIGSSNVSLGKASLATNVDGSKSVAVGELSLTTQDPSGATDMHNVAVGYQAGTAVTTGTQNTLIGNLSGDVVTTGSGNTSLGYNTAFSANSASNQTVIGNGATGQGDNIVVIGNSSVASINPGNATVSLGTTTNPYQDIFVSRNIKSSLDSSDLAITQFDGNEVARIHDGGTNQNTGALNALGHGFGFKMPIMILSADGGDKTLTLDAKQSGSIIQCDADTNNIVFNLPVIDASNKAGITYTFVNTTAVDSGHTVIINTNGTDGNDKFLMYGFNGATSITDVAGDTLTIPNSAAIGTVVRITCLSSGASNAAEIWLAEVFGASAVTNA